MPLKTMKTTLFSAFTAAVLLAGSTRGWQEPARVVPPPAFDPPAAGRTSEVAVLAGGCFWGVQGVYQHVKGVTNAVSGYAGGDKSTAVYERVGTGTTGHAESVEITFDPREVSYGRLLQVFFSVVHNPTQLNRQGPDVGTEYRSAIFPMNADQEAVARAYVNQLQIARAFSAPVVTKIEPGKVFYRAEEYHQDYLERNPSNPYIAINDLPKLRDLQRVFPGMYRDTPILVRKDPHQRD
jgi:peptide-methionine (S)-S-oxide reductase